MFDIEDVIKDILVKFAGLLIVLGIFYWNMNDPLTKDIPCLLAILISSYSCSLVSMWYYYHEIDFVLAISILLLFFIIVFACFIFSGIPSFSSFVSTCL